jgi:uncharacterized membrane protein
MMNVIKGTALFVSLLYLTFYVPMTLTFYTPAWMKFNCDYHKRCEVVGIEEANEGISELSAYFRHQSGLESFYTEKEKLHLKEVRGIFDKLFIGSLGALILLALTFNRKRASRFALVNTILVLSLLLVLPFFGTFWKDIFHPLMFNNELWMNNQYDLSFYIMPRQFFKYTVGLLTVLCFLINAAIWLGLRKRD